MPDAPLFSYEQAFDRNIGWLTEWEQQALRGKRIAIAGMGGVGALHLLTLARLGVGAFHIADLDRFELANFNRQFGATTETLDRPKVEVLEEMARSINPEVRIKRFDQGVTLDTLGAFLEGVDLFVDGLDFFVLDMRRRVFARCAEIGIPAVTAAPIGMGAGFIAFVPGGMSFEEYFRLEGQTENRQYLRFLMGVAPRGLHRPYLVDPSRVDLKGQRGPSTVAACELCAGITAVAALKLLLGRGGLKPAPYHHHFDPYRGKLAVTKLRWGNAGPLQRVKLAVAQRLYDAMSNKAAAPIITTAPLSPLENILNAARWAPSGDNAQPWRFRITGTESVLIYLDDHSATDVYEYRGSEPSILAAGMLLASLRIAASAAGRTMEWSYEGSEDGRHRIAARFAEAPHMAQDPLYSWLSLRSVDRRPYRRRALTAVEKSELERCLGEDLALDWHEAAAKRWRLAGLGAKATDIRLRIPEAFRVHQRVIDWQNAHSPTGIPAGAVGLDPLSLAIMRWGMRDWSRMRLLNRFGGTMGAMLQLDYLPGLFSAAFFTVRPARPLPAGSDRIAFLLRAGEQLLRFWLTATRLGLALQPGLATLAFAYYGDADAGFTEVTAMRKRAARLGQAFRSALQAAPQDILFLGRIGQARARMPAERSTRRPLAELIDKPPA